MSTEYERPGLVHVLIRERDEARVRADSKHDCWMSELRRTTELECDVSDICRAANAHTADEACEVIRAMREAIQEAHAALSRVITEAKAREGLQCGCPSMVTMYLKAEVVDESRAALAKLNPFTTGILAAFPLEPIEGQP